MGHRDIWGKNPKNWKKQCPCFDAEAEYKDVGEPFNKPKLDYSREDNYYLNRILSFRSWK